MRILRVESPLLAGRRTIALACFTALTWFIGNSVSSQDSPPPSSAQSGPVYVIPVNGEVEGGLYWFINRGVNKAERAKARAVILNMNTPGGAVDAAIKIRDRLVKTDIPTYTFVDNMAISAGAFIAIATDKIIMAEGSNIGGALPYAMAPGGAPQVEEKMISIFSSELRKTAKRNGHPEDIAEAFANPDLVIEGVKEKGKILTLDYDQATSLGLAAYVAPSLDSMLDREGMGDAPTVDFKLTGGDRVARFLANPIIMSLLMLLGMGGLFFEIKTPGFGVAGTVGLISLALYFFGAWLANLSGYWEIIFFILGVALLAVEIFLIPGFGVFGFAGILLIFGSLFFALFNLAPEGFDFHWTVRLEKPLLVMVLAFILSIPLIWFISWLLPQTPVYGTLRLAPPEPRRGGTMEAAANSLRIGMEGKAITDLRPAGMAVFEGERVDVLTEGDWINQNEPVVIMRIEGNRVFVRNAARS